MSSAVANEPMSRWSTWRDPAAVAAAGAGLFALLRLHDPHDSGSYGFCPSLILTGIPCPGCGGLRAVNDLTHGDLAAAVSSNVIAVGLVAGLAVAWLAWTVRRARGRPGPMLALSARWGYAALAVLVVFGVVRNLPFGAALAP
ncbi:DUF2752 domain-containing protein [Aeromicrobium sp. CF3.5]|uniref:DUF2752 domain-containing protein n=1 Tax=Aeromicrobium sp. CF3.5 TaxID=3373078 RepID=UPI003EE5A674